MASFYVTLLLAAVFSVHLYNAENLQVGTSVNMQLAYNETVKLSSIPFTTRVKNVFFNSEKVIKGISVIDLDASKAKPTITSGGVGSTYVNVKIKSEKGDGLNYFVQIFV